MRLALRRTLVLGFGLVALAASAPASACELPSLPVAAAETNGADAALVAKTQDYLAGIREYLRCTWADLDAAGGEAAPERLRSTLTTRSRFAIVEAAAVVATFNERVDRADALALDEWLDLDSQPCLESRPVRDAVVVHDRVVLLTLADESLFLSSLQGACERFDVGFLVSFSLRETPRPFCSGDSLSPGRADPEQLRRDECKLGRFYPLAELRTSVRVRQGVSRAQGGRAR
jgi:hypothetical protein